MRTVVRFAKGLVADVTRVPEGDDVEIEVIKFDIEPEEAPK